MRTRMIWLVPACLLLAGCGDIALRDILAQTVTGATSLAQPSAPNDLTVTMLSVSKLHLAWTDSSSNEMGFKIERSTTGTTGWTLVGDVVANTTIWDDVGLADGTSYSYRVRAYNTAGDSGDTNIASATTDTLIPIALVTIVSGGDSFQMGDGSYGPNPPVSETIQAYFNMSTYDITNAMFAQFVADDGYSTQSYWTTNGWAWKGNIIQPNYWSDSGFNSANQPVGGVSWYEAVAFCNWRTVREGRTVAYDAYGQATLSATGYRLPTEVEWEYAAAKGGSSQSERIYAWGDTWDSSKAVCSVPPAAATSTADVGSRSPGGDTPQGLVDMSGNAWQWCSDNYEADAGISSGTNRYYFADDSPDSLFIYRGGAWLFTIENRFRCAYRNGYGVPGSRYTSNSFRVVRH